MERKSKGRGLAVIMPVGGVLVWLLVAFFATTSHAQSDQWKPKGPVEIVVTGGPGGGNDRTARKIQQVLQELRLVDTPVTVANKPGGGGAIAWSYLNQHAGDAHYLSVTFPSLLTNHIIGRSTLHFRDFTPIAQLFTEYYVLMVRADSPLKSGTDLLNRLKQDPQSLTVGVAPGLGAASHAVTGMIVRAVGIDVKRMRVVIDPSSNRNLIALLGGHIDVVPVSAGNAVVQLKAGKVRVLGVAAPRRLGGVLADVPTWKEQGVNVDLISNTRGVMGPRGLTPAQVALWQDVFSRLSRTEEWKKYLDTFLGQPLYIGGTRNIKYLEQREAELKEVLTELGLAK
ncbi:MAG: tripartite tricarboxylate transporter substrate binding protein [Betaproteobacteria bacterium]|nr:tripartite tricarboxylate transporter substrate binding protein [Betaproteobacteria bacterium]